MLSMCDYEMVRLFYKWLNRRSKSRSMTWTRFMRRLPGWELLPLKVVERSAQSQIAPNHKTCMMMSESKTKDRRCSKCAFPISKESQHVGEQSQLCLFRMSDRYPAG